MSTYAVYQLWAGVSKVHLDAAEDAPEGFLNFAEERLPLRGPIPGDVLCEAIFMHGELVGYGRVVHRMEWITVDDLPATPNLASLSYEAEDVRLDVEKLFRERGLTRSIPVRVYHHIDLGG